MSGSVSTPVTSGLVILAIIVFVMARRTYALTQGAQYGPTRIFAYGAFSTALFLFFAASTIYVAYGLWGPVGFALLAPYAAVPVAAAWIAIPHVRRRVRFEKRSDGLTYYRLPILLPLLSLVVFLVRVGVEIWAFGLANLFSFTFPTTLPLGTLLVLIGVDLLFGVSIGMLYGRGLAVRAAFAAQSQVADAPLQA